MMKRDFKSCMLYSVFGLPIFLLLFIAILYVANCGLDADCSQTNLPGVIHTPIPTLIPASLPMEEEGEEAAGQVKCSVTARTLLQTWVDAGYAENEPFQFTDLRGNTCQATYADVRILFSEGNLWFSGALACIQCHNADLETASAKMDLSSYEGILAGSYRSSAEDVGNEILGSGVWEQSKLHEVLFVTQTMPFGRPPGAVGEDGPTVLAGEAIQAP